MNGSPAELTLSRSSQGRIELEMVTEQGAVKVELDEAAYVRLMFGEAHVPGVITRHLLLRRPVRKK